MFHFSYFKSFYNFLRRNKLYTLINVFGFAASLTFVILMGLYVQDELSVDDFHKNKDRIYRLEHHEGPWLPPGLPQVLEDRYPEIEATVRTCASLHTVDIIPGYTNQKISEHTLFADSTFFSIFSFPLIEGDPASVMRTNDDIVLTESFARKLFGSESAFGKTIRIKDVNYHISGIAKDFKHTHFRNPGIIIPFPNIVRLWNTDKSLMTEVASSHDFVSYFLAKPGTDLQSKTSDLDYFMKDELQHDLFISGYLKDLRFNPLSRVYFTPGNTKQVSDYNDRTYVNILSITVLLILLFAVINYINLSVAQTGFRAKETAMRRLLGANKRQVFWGFIGESALLCLVSFLLAIGLAYMAEPFFQNMLNTQVTVSEGLTTTNILAALGGILVLSVISGWVPAKIISRYEPIEVVKGTFRRQTKMVFSKVLITFQYAVTIVLIGCSVTIIRQIHYMQDTELGFDKDYVLVCENFCTKEQQPGFREELLSIPGVETVAFADQIPGTGQYHGRYGHFDLEGTIHDLWGFNTDASYLSLMDFEIIHTTTAFNPTGTNYWLNETAWRQLGLDPDATEYTNAEAERYKFKVAGMIKDFYTDDFSTPIQEILIVSTPDYRGRQIFVKVSPAEAFKTADRIREAYNQWAGGNYYDGRFISEEIASMYESQKRMSQIIGSLSVIALIISALGMLAMATYYAAQRAEEMAVRKVFGAMNREVLALSLASFLKLIVIAFVIATPFIWYFMRDWLSGYAYRISLSWSIFALAGSVAFVIATLTVLWQSIRIANANPALTLKKN